MYFGIKYMNLETKLEFNERKNVILNLEIKNHTVAVCEHLTVNSIDFFP